MFKHLFSTRFGTVYLFGLLFTLIAFVTRTTLLIKAWSVVDLNPLNLLAIYLVGLLFDGVTATYFVLFLVLYLIFIPDRVFNHRLHQPVFLTLFFLFLYGLVFGIVSEWIFWDEFGVRFNFIAVDYLVYTEEVLKNIWQSYPVPALLTAIFILTGLVFHQTWKRGYLTASFNNKRTTLAGRAKQGSLFLALPILFFFLVDSSLSEISPNRYHNELAKNGVHALFSAFRNNKLDYADFYLQKEEDLILTRLRALLKSDNSHFLSDDLRDITRRVSGNGPEKRHNVIFITIESLSAEFMGKFGNQAGLTPHLDRLADESLFFSNIYATGTRTVRGMESLTLSVPPSPGRSMVKRPDNENLFSSGFVFKSKGYDTQFLYGGYGYFDNMNYFFGNNGFDIVDRAKMDDDKISHENAWGVADEDIYRRATEEADRAYGEGKPFFHFIMTTSNHRPYTYPAGRIDIPSPGGREGGVKYTDYAIHRFIEDTRSKPWFDNTLFVIISDHCAGSAGRTELPVYRYRIPFLIYQPALIKAATNDRLVSQLDVIPTVLGLLNWSYTSRFYGRDILRMRAEDERAFIGNYQKLGLIQGNNLAILSPQNGSSFYQFDRQTEEQTTLPPQPDLLFDAMAYYQGASILAKHGGNRWIDETP
ncbi:MAG: sulfatase-like hydrolase/transferase [Magnetococcales bacterium]|nr:sulfatase-like hydrolase/transferase [Magnetococcales bacterium]